MTHAVDWQGVRQNSGILFDGSTVSRGRTYDGEEVVFGGSTDLLQLTQDPAENKSLITAALALGDVKLVTGTYPLAPGIDVNGRTLDLNGSTLIGSVTPFYNGAWIRMMGDSPCIKNGTFEGHYNAAPGEPGYVPLETGGNGIETVIGLPQGDFANAVLDGVTFYHICGYVVCGKSGVTSRLQLSGETEPVDGWSRFTLSGTYPLVTARHAVGYNYYISSEDVQYRFYDADDNLIGEDSGVPGEAITVPSGSVAVATHVTGTYKRYGLFEYNYDNSITISGCTFRCNQRLGIANLPGVSVIEDCVSVSNGYPREDHTGITWDSSTSGFIDIEDVQSPVLTVNRCTSDNEHLGVASRAYHLYVNDCVPLYVFLYDGWDAYIDGVTHIYFINTEAYNKITLISDDEWSIIYP